MLNALSRKFKVCCFTKSLKKSKNNLISSNRFSWMYLVISYFQGATEAESITVFGDLFHDPSSGPAAARAQPKCKKYDEVKSS